MTSPPVKVAAQAVQSIDIATLRFNLKNRTFNQGSEIALQAETKGIQVQVDEVSQNISIIHEDGLRENFITLVQDMSGLMKLGGGNDGEWGMVA